MPKEASIKTPEIDDVRVEPSQQLSGTRFAELAKRFPEADVRTVREILRDESAIRVRTLFNGRQRADGSMLEVGVFALMSDIEKTGKIPRTYEGVIRRLHFAQATTEREVGEAEISVEESAKTNLQDSDPELATQRELLLHNKLEELAVLLLFEKWLIDLQVEVESKATTPAAAGARAPEPQAQATQPTPPEKPDEKMDANLEETKRSLQAAEILANDIEQILSVSPNSTDSAKVVWNNAQLILTEALTQAMLKLKTEQSILEAGGMDEKRYLETYLKPMLVRLARLHERVNEQLKQIEVQKIIDSIPTELSQLRTLVTAINSLPAELSSDHEPLHMELSTLISSIKTIFDEVPDESVRQILIERVLKDAIDTFEKLSLKRAKFLIKPLVKQLDDTEAILAGKASGSYESLVKAVDDIEKERNIVFSTVKSSPLLKVRPVEIELETVGNRINTVIAKLTSKIDETATAELLASPLVAEMRKLLQTVEELSEEDILKKGQPKSATGKNLGRAELDQIQTEIERTAAGLVASKMWGETDFKQSPQAEKIRRDLVERSEQAKKKLKKLIADANNWERPQSATKAVTEFFEGGYLPFPQEWRNGEWRTENPELLAKAIWKYVYEKIIMASTKEDLPFMQLTILEGRIRGEQQAPKISELLDSFAALDTQLTDIPRKDGKPRGTKDFVGLAEKLGIDFSELEHIYRLGRGVNSTETDPDGMVSFLTNTDNQMRGVDMKRTYGLGRGYCDQLSSSEVLSDEILPADRILWAQQAYFAMNDPEIATWGYIAAEGKTDHDVIMKNVGIKNPLSIFPAAATDASVIKFRRDAVRILIGSSKPPEWISRPITRNAKESLHDFAIRRKKEIARIVKEKIDENIRQSQQKADGIPTEYEKYLSKEDQNARVVGYFAEQVSMNLGEYALEPCRAEGTKLKTKNKKKFTINGHTIEADQIEPSAGPASIFIAARWFFSGAYRRKLMSENKAEGSPGPRKTLSDFNELLQTMYDYYQYVPQDEREGVTLKELILLAQKSSDMGELPYETILSSKTRPTDSDSPWAQMVKLAPNHYGRIVDPEKHVAISWQSIRQAVAGLEGQFTFNPGVVSNKLMAILREVTYMMQRDMGLKLHTWNTKQDHDSFRLWEKEYLRQVEAGEEIKKPPSCNDEVWDQVLELNALRKPSHQYEIFDIQNPEGSGIVRYASKMRSAVNMPVDETMMNQFERVVLRPVNGHSNDHWAAAKKLFFGKILIGSMVSSGVERISYKDSVVILEVLSHDAWVRGHFNVFSRFMRALRGVQTPTYEGLGLFTELEAKTLLAEAGVSQGLWAKWQDYVEAVSQFETASGGGRKR